MNKVYYNKLVRDAIQQKIADKGEACEIRSISDPAEFQQELLKKVVEEAVAVSRSRTRKEFLSEYADLMVVLDALTAHMEFSEADIKTTIEENLQKKGGFKKQHFLHWSETVDYISNETSQGIQ